MALEEEFECEIPRRGRPRKLPAFSRQSTTSRPTSTSKSMVLLPLSLTRFDCRLPPCALTGERCYPTRRISPVGMTWRQPGTDPGRAQWHWSADRVRFREIQCQDCRRDSRFRSRCLLAPKDARKPTSVSFITRMASPAHPGQCRAGLDEQPESGRAAYGVAIGARISGGPPHPHH